MLNANGQSYYDGIMKAAGKSDNPHLTGQIDDLEQAAVNFQRSMVAVYRPTSTATYRAHKKLIHQVVGLMPGGITGDVYDCYCNHARCQDLEPRSYRRFTQLLKELEQEGEITSQRLNRGRGGRTRSWTPATGQRYKTSTRRRIVPGAVFISRETTGKLGGISAINTDPIDNTFGQRMRCSSNNRVICKYCYSCHMATTYRSKVRPRWQENLRILTERVLGLDELPEITGELCRLNSHGCLQDLVQLTNYVNIAWVNPEAKLALWTKRMDLLKQYFAENSKPENLMIIYSTPLLDQQPIREDLVPWFVDRVFTVYTYEYARDEGIDLNCPATCYTCRICYERSIKLLYVNEELSSRF